MLSPREVIETTDWKSLYHAYEHAEDTPDRLLGLLSEEPEVCGDVLAFLDAAVLHQGTIYPVTPPVVVFVAGILDDEVDNDDDDDDDDARKWHAYSIAATRVCRALLPEVYQAIRPFLDDPDDDVRQAAFGAVGQMMAAPELIEFRGEQVGRLLREAASHGASRLGAV